MYLTIKIYRFYIRCPVCGSEITFKTDPKNADYVAELGAKRNFEPWRDELKEGEETKNRRLLEELNNPMKALENKTYDSKREIEIMEGLDEIRMGNARLELVDTDSVFVKVATKETDEDLRRRQEEEEDDELVRQAFAKKKMPEIEYEGWSDEDDTEIVREAPLVADSAAGNAVEQLAKELGVEPLAPLSVRPSQASEILSNSSLSRSKKQALLGIAPKKHKGEK